MGEHRNAPTAPLRDSLRVSNDTRNLINVRNFVQGMIRRSALDPMEENKVILAVDEAISNIIEHGYGPNRNGSIEVEITTDARSFIVTIRDEGRVFDPKSREKIDIERHVREGRRRGLGIFLMRRIMDEVRYAYRDDRRNELVLIKLIDVD